MGARGYLLLLHWPNATPPRSLKAAPMPFHGARTTDLTRPQPVHLPAQALNEQAPLQQVCPSLHAPPFSVLPQGQACSADREVAEAIQRWDLEKLLKLLQEGADVHQAGPAALKMAAQENDLEQLRGLLAMLQHTGVDLNTIDPHGDTALAVAAREGHHEAVKVLTGALLQSGGDVNAVNRYGFTPLAEAAYKGHRQAVAVLIDALAQSGGDVNVSTPGCGTALTLAIDDGNLEAADRLLLAGAVATGQDLQDAMRLLGFHDISTVNADILARAAEQRLPGLANALSELEVGATSEQRLRRPPL